ncbi:hypothetical protein BH23GEM1_BH23GEM1_10760 [soil metagenome]
MIRSVLAIVAGYVVAGLLTVLATMASASIVGPTPPRSYVWMNLLYSGVFAFVGGYVAATMAPRKPLNHALILAGIMLVAGAAYALGGPRGELPAREPDWYPWLLVVVAPALVVLGGWIRERAARRQHPQA